MNESTGHSVTQAPSVGNTRIPKVMRFHADVIVDFASAIQITSEEFRAFLDEMHEAFRGVRKVYEQTGSRPKEDL